MQTADTWPLQWCWCCACTACTVTSRRALALQWPCAVSNPIPRIPRTLRNRPHGFPAESPWPPQPCRPLVDKAPWVTVINRRTTHSHGTESFTSSSCLHSICTMTSNELHCSESVIVHLEVNTCQSFTVRPSSDRLRDSVRQQLTANKTQSSSLTDRPRVACSPCYHPRLTTSRVRSLTSFVSCSSSQIYTYLQRQYWPALDGTNGSLCSVKVLSFHRTIHCRQFYLTFEVHRDWAVLDCCVSEVLLWVSQLSIQPQQTHS